MKNRLWLPVIAFPACQVFFPDIVLAFQAHGPKEGLLVHQLGHVCFFAVMVWLYFMIRKSSFWQKKCWRSIARGSAMLALWNVVAFTGHILSLYRVNNFSSGLQQGPNLIFWIWYACKLDHLVCVPALFFFYAGLKQLLVQLKTEKESPKEMKG